MMNGSALFGSRGMVYLCLILSLALSLQGSPLPRRAQLQRSGWSSAVKDPILAKPSEKVDIPLLPPDENLDAVSLKRGTGRPVGPPDYEGADYEDDGVSGQETEGISGEGPIDYPDFNFPFPVGKPVMREFANRGNAE
ncbi:uncharacterized protein LOC144600872 [Rhinoraja longicauda]